MKVKKRNIVVFTDSFPYGGVSEGAFVEPELKLLAEKFDRVVIVPTCRLSEVAISDMPSGVEVSEWWINCKEWVTPWRRVKYMLSTRFLRSLSLKCRYTDLTFILSAVTFSYALKRWLKEEKLTPENTLLYTFWFDIAAGGVSFLSEYEWITRMHGHDMYTWRGRKLRKQMVDKVLRIFTASEAGREYMESEYPSAAAKIETAILGCVKYGGRDVTAQSHCRADGALTFLTVSRAVEGKGLMQTVDLLRSLAISRPDIQVRWVYVGGGILAEKLRMYCDRGPNPKNFSVDFRGELANADVHKIYATEPIDWVMLLSDSEGGNPVSLCEAMAYGVPVIGKECRGVSETIDDSCGILLSNAPTEEEFVYGLAPYIDSDVRMGVLRQGALRRWQERYDAEKLRKEFWS